MFMYLLVTCVFLVSVLPTPCAIVGVGFGSEIVPSEASNCNESQRLLIQVSESGFHETQK